MADKREFGTVTKYDSERKFGFIKRQAGGKDVFVGRDEINRAGLKALNEGDRMSFTVKQTEKGLAAENLKLEKGTFQFGPDYLREGYFETKDGKPYLRPEVLDALAMDIAQLLGNRGMKSHQLRRFFSKARGIEAKLDRDKDFEAIKADIHSFKPDVVYQVGRKLVPEEFKQFMDRNVELAVVDEKSFRQGFLQHFQSVLAYFVYFFRESDSGR